MLCDTVALEPTLEHNKCPFCNGSILKADSATCKIYKSSEKVAFGSQANSTCGACIRPRSRFNGGERGMGRKPLSVRFDRLRRVVPAVRRPAAQRWRLRDCRRHERPAVVGEPMPQQSISVGKHTIVPAGLLREHGQPWASQPLLEEHRP